MATISREKNATATRADILAAARRLFAAESYEGVGMRDVAREAGVNVALVSRYFGSKEILFRKVLLERRGEWFGGAKTQADLAQWLGNLPFADGDEDSRADLERLYIILRSASSPVTATIISEAFVEDVFAPLANLLGPGSAQVRAGLALSLVIGATVLNGILSVDTIGPELREEGRARLNDMIAQALAAD